jgi:hypothetical protein
VSIDVLIERMQRIGAEIPAADPLRIFHGTYTRITEAVRDEIRRGGFSDNEWTERWDVAFAGLYLRALDQWRSGISPSGPWKIALDATKGPHLPPLRHVLLGINAHINLDLPQALLAVITDAEFETPAVIVKRSADHVHIDTILSSRVAAEDQELKKLEMSGDSTLIDRLLTPFNRLGTKRFLREAREKVWHNARVLSDARRQGPDVLASRIGELERLASTRVEQLTRPGQVLLELTRNGFGVLLK